MLLPLALHLSGIRQSQEAQRTNVMNKLIFATNNPHKLDEVRKLLAGKYEVISLEQLGCHDDIPETADTLQGNALLKAQYIHRKYGVHCFADDTGLEVEVLDNAPGVYSARYAGEHCSPADNRAKLLHALSEVAEPRKASVGHTSSKEKLMEKLHWQSREKADSATIQFSNRRAIQKHSPR